MRDWANPAYTIKNKSFLKLVDLYDDLEFNGILSIINVIFFEQKLKLLKENAVKNTFKQHMLNRNTILFILSKL